MTNENILKKRYLLILLIILIILSVEFSSSCTHALSDYSTDIVGAKISECTHIPGSFRCTHMVTYTSIYGSEDVGTVDNVIFD